MTTAMNHVLWPLDVFGNGMERMVRDAFRSFPAAEATAGIAVDLWEDEDNYHVEANVPGLRSEDIDVSLDGRRLILKGTSAASEESADQRRWHYRERATIRFERAFSLPGLVNPDGIRADLTNGVLHLTLPKAEEDKPRRIQIKTD